MQSFTDPQDEPFDVLDAEGQPTGVVKPRGEIHRDGDWHRGLHIWVYGFNEQQRPYVLFQRRSQSKDTWPGALDVAVWSYPDLVDRSALAIEAYLRSTTSSPGSGFIHAAVSSCARRS